LNVWLISIEAVLLSRQGRSRNLFSPSYLAKVAQIKTIVKEHQLDILVLQETNLNSETIVQFENAFIKGMDLRGNGVP